jgi:hypothetical protein
VEVKMWRTLLQRLVFPVLSGVAVFGVEYLLTHGHQSAITSHPAYMIAPAAVAAGAGTVSPHHVVAAVAGLKVLAIAALVVAVISIMMLMAVVVLAAPLGF